MKGCTKLSILLATLVSTCVFANNEAIQYFHRKVVAQKLPEAAVAMNNKDYKKAFDIYKVLADQNEGVAQYQLAYLYQNGLGVPKDLQRASNWYLKANEHPIPIA